MDRNCKECGKLVDNYGRCRTDDCSLNLKPQHENITYEKQHGKERKPQG